MMHHKHGKRSTNRAEKRLESAWAVCGVKIPGRSLSVYCFGTRTQANKFQRKHGGILHHHTFVKLYDATGRKSDPRHKLAADLLARREEREG